DLGKGAHYIVKLDNFSNSAIMEWTLALSMTLFCHGRCHLTITDTTCNDNRMRLDQPQKGRSIDKCETVSWFGILLLL
ncbi:hypothetical protein Tsp_09122, partial [Trichinella spiralis]|uniref:hypothetical protein n=1 Tax=Trichinella spiralis TaxID=6334 RepID=UPI0001EFCB6C